MSNSIKTALLAFGMSGQVFHAPFIEAHPSFILYGALQRHIDNVRTKYPHVKAYDSLEAMLADEDLDLIVINTPNFTHYEFAKKALLAGKHILVEKPFTCTLAEAQELFSLAKKEQKHIFVYQNRRYDSGFSAFRDVIESGRLGKIVEINFRFDRFRNHIGPKQFKETNVPGAGLLYDLGPHLIDQAISLFGKPTQVVKTLGYQRDNTLVDDYFHLHLTYPEQLQIHLTASLLVAEPREAFVVHGHKGSFRKMHADVQESQLLAGLSPMDNQYGIEREQDAGALTLLMPDGSFQQHTIPSKKGDYMLFFQAVADTILRDKPFPVKEEEILWQLEILACAPNQIHSF